MGSKDSGKKQEIAPGDKLDALRIALQNKDKPSGKFMKAFETLMRKDKPGAD